MLRASLCALALLLPTSARAGAADGTCDTALVLAVDISNSVVEDEYRLQIDGLADALRDPRVSEVLVEGRVALAVMQWSGPEEQHISAPWRLMEAPADVLNMSAFVRTIPRASEGLGTAPAEAIHAALDLMAQAPPCARQVIDVSGDGRRNQGRDTGKARDVAHARGIVINGIAIETLGQGVADFYREELVTPGGFVMAARGHRDYARAIREKILRELAAPVS
jgi:Ca-activated chloride channel family protein